MPSNKQFQGEFPTKKTVRLLKSLRKANNLGKAVYFGMTPEVKDSIEVAVKVAAAVNPNADLRMPGPGDYYKAAQDYLESHRNAARRADEFEEYLGWAWVQADQLLELLTSPVISDDHKCCISHVAYGWLVSFSLELERLLVCWRKLEAGEKDLPL